MSSRMKAKRVAIPLVALAVALAALWITNRAVTPKEATWHDAMNEAHTGGYRLITTDELNRRLRSSPDSILLVDTRQEWELAAGHLPGAVNFPMEPTWWSGWRKQGALEQVLGPDKNRFIVFY